MKAPQNWSPALMAGCSSVHRLVSELAAPGNKRLLNPQNQEEAASRPARIQSASRRLLHVLAPSTPCGKDGGTQKLPCEAALSCHLAPFRSRGPSCWHGMRMGRTFHSSHSPHKQHPTYRAAGPSAVHRKRRQRAESNRGLRAWRHIQLPVPPPRLGPSLRSNSCSDASFRCSRVLRSSSNQGPGWGWSAEEDPESQHSQTRREYPGMRSRARSCGEENFGRQSEGSKGSEREAEGHTEPKGGHTHRAPLRFRGKAFASLFQDEEVVWGEEVRFHRRVWGTGKVRGSRDADRGDEQEEERYAWGPRTVREYGEGWRREGKASGFVFQGSSFSSAFCFFWEHKVRQQHAQQFYEASPNAEPRFSDWGSQQRGGGWEGGGQEDTHRRSSGQREECGWGSAAGEGKSGHRKTGEQDRGQGGRPGSQDRHRRGEHAGAGGARTGSREEGRGGGGGGYEGARSEWGGAGAGSGGPVNVDERMAGQRMHRLVLGLPQGGLLTTQSVKSAFRLCAMAWHPDKHQEGHKSKAEGQFRRALEAYKALLPQCVL